MVDLFVVMFWVELEELCVDFEEVFLDYCVRCF